MFVWMDEVSVHVSFGLEVTLIWIFEPIDRVYYLERFQGFILEGLSIFLLRRGLLKRNQYRTSMNIIYRGE